MIICDINDAGLGVRKFCYAGLKMAYKNRTPVPEDFETEVNIDYCLYLAFQSIFCKIFSNILFHW